MKIKVERDKIVKAVKKLEGIELVLENVDDAREALNLLLAGSEMINKDQLAKLKDLQVTPLQEYNTSAVDYKVLFLLEFVFDEGFSTSEKIALIKQLQAFFEKF
ncbi:MAG: hypothetical protein JW884_03290 [Deltaproteobacteria bacterium]|nr:hypothetical protein [Deltaproteobacteria bacterium]